jgi:hypothetical protein
MDNFEFDDIDETNITDLNQISEWTNEHEKILIEWGDKAMCYRWLHSRSNMMYSTLNAWYTIPVIIISTVTGTANFAQERVPINYQNYFVMIVGSFNILAGIITTIQQFLKITQLNEAHRVSSIAWDKFYRNIKMELAKHPRERMDVKHMLKICKEEFDRLMETSPIIPDSIVNEFKTSFKKTDTYKQIVKPEICDVLIPTNEYRNSWFNDENKMKSYMENMQLKKAKEIKAKKIFENQKKIVKDFIEAFINLNNREPTEIEITDNLKDKIEIILLKSIISILNNNIQNTVLNENNV